MNEQADFEPRPYFATAGRPGQFFVVSEDITSERALEGASTFLGTAVSLGSNSDALDDGARWAIVHLVEGVARPCQAMPRPGPVPGFSLAGLIRIARIRLLSAYSSGDDKKPDLVSRAICLISLVGRVRLELTTNGLKVLKNTRFFMLNGIHENV